MNTIRDLLSYKGIFVSDSRESKKLGCPVVKVDFPEMSLNLSAGTCANLGRLVLVHRQVSPMHIIYKSVLKRGLR